MHEIFKIIQFLIIVLFFSDKIKDSLEEFFLPLENESAQLPVSDSDLKNIKHNLRK